MVPIGDTAQATVGSMVLQGRWDESRICAAAMPAHPLGLWMVWPRQEHNLADAVISDVDDRRVVLAETWGVRCPFGRLS